MPFQPIAILLYVASLYFQIVVLCYIPIMGYIEYLLEKNHFYHGTGLDRPIAQVQVQLLSTYRVQFLKRPLIRIPHLENSKISSTAILYDDW